MKKRLIIGLLIAGIIGSGWLYWHNISVDMDFSQDSAENDVEYIEITDSFEISKDTIVVTDKDKTEALDPQPTQSGENPQTNENMSKENQQTKTPETITTEELEAQIITHYTTHFLNLRKKYEGRIDRVIEEAKAEYFGLPESKRKTAMYTMALKYFKKANVLEASSDKEFDAILNRMKLDLEKYNVSTDVIKLIKKQYEDEKNARRRSLMNHAMGVIK